MDYSSPPGLFDIVPEPKEAWRASHLWAHLERTCREVSRLFGYREVRTPILEKSALFARSSGDSSDIVSKEMYEFQDRGGRSLALRPEATAPILRAVVEEKMLAQGGQQKLFCIGPMFRYDRPQAGRYRQHHQFSAEVLGVEGPWQDVEVIHFAMTLYRSLGLKNLTLLLNSLGDREARAAHRQALVDYLTPKRAKLSEESQKRLESNPLRILDSKEEQDQEIIVAAPPLAGFLSERSREHFSTVQALCHDLGLEYTLDPTLVRGLDYYCETVFEVVSTDLGAQSSIGGGGRYDGLLRLVGGPDLPGVGFAAGLERVLQVLLAQGALGLERERTDLYLIPLGEEAKSACFSLLSVLRERGIAAEMDYTGRKLGKVMNLANKLGVHYVAVVGEEELRTKKVSLKEMKTGKATECDWDEIANQLERHS